jgi:hypothetical protein
MQYSLHNGEGPNYEGPDSKSCRALERNTKKLKKVELALQRAVEVRRVVRYGGSYIFSRHSVHRWRYGCRPYAPAALSPEKFVVLISFRG